MTTYIFALDDDEAFLKVLSIRLRAWREDIQFTTASSIAEAKQVLLTSDKPFSLAIIDQHLPDGMGVEIIEHPRLATIAVLAVSSDSSPALPANSVRAGAQHYLTKRQVSEPLFVPLIEALIERKRLENELLQAKLRESQMDTIKVLLATLRHEINNPLGAVIGGTYLLKNFGTLDKEQQEALTLIEQSSQRIKHVIQQLCETAELEKVEKAKEVVFQVPGDAPWEQSKK